MIYVSWVVSMHFTKFAWIGGSRLEETTAPHVVRRYVYLVASNQFFDDLFQGVSNDDSPSDESSASNSTTTPQPMAL